MNRKIASHYALIDSHLERNIVIEVDSRRRIVAIERVADIDTCANVEFYSGILLAGMVNAHCHLELSYLRGAIEEHTGFAGFAREIGRVRNNFSDEERIAAAAAADAQMWEEGVEAVADIANDELIMPIKERSNIRYHTLFELFGLNNRSLDAHIKMASSPNSSITPHSTYSVQDAIFRDIAARGTAPLSLHFLESDAEAALYCHRGPLYEWYERMGWSCDFLKYGMPAERIVESIPPERRTLLVHNCAATPIDIMTVETHLRNVSWVLCPESNRYISDRQAPAAMLRSMGVNIALGSDSLASARTLSMVDNMRLINDVPLVELLLWATKGGARAMGWDEELGDLRVGTSPGIVLLEGTDLQQLQLTPTVRTRRII